MFLSVSQESLTINKHLLEQKDAELRRAHKQIERCIQENRSSLEALEEEKKRSRLAVSRGRRMLDDALLQESNADTLASWDS